MGGIAKRINKITGHNVFSVDSPEPYVKRGSQQTTGLAVEKESDGRSRKKSKRKGKKGLMIPTQATSVASPGGSGVGKGT